MLKKKRQELETPPAPHTDASLVSSHGEGLDQVLQERADQPEVDPPDAPGAVHQDHDVSYRWARADKPICRRQSI